MPRLHLQHMHTQHIVVHERNIQKATCGMGPPRRSMYNGSTGKEHDIRKNWVCAKDPFKGVLFVSPRQQISAEHGLIMLYTWHTAALTPATDPHLFRIHSHRENASNVQAVGSKVCQSIAARKRPGTIPWHT